MNIVAIYRRFPKHEDCVAHLEVVRWKGRAQCPYCFSRKITPVPKERRHHCNTCNISFSVTVGTIFHNTKLDLQKWFLAIALILNAKKGLSARQLARDLEVNKNTAWYMAMRVRKAMDDNGELLKGMSKWMKPMSEESRAKADPSGNAVAEQPRFRLLELSNGMGT